MRTISYPDAGAFLDATADLRAADPLRMNIVGSVAQGVVEGRRYDGYWWLGIEDSSAHLVGCALRTSPYNAVVSPMPAAAAAEVGRYLAASDPLVPGLTGPRDVVAAALDAAVWTDRARVRIDEVMRVLGFYTPAEVPAPGAARLAMPTDLDLLLDWLGAFATEAGLPKVSTRDEVERRLDSLWVWEDAEPVAMAGHSPIVPDRGGGVVRIGPVYTPPARRGRGYGTAVTSAVVEALLPRGASIMLFADAANPASNRVYERLGFTVAAELVEVELASAEIDNHFH